jgi:hypothetical protein
MDPSAVLHIDLAAIVANWRALTARAAPGAVAGVVKANAYGLGAAQVAPALHAAGCRHFFVAHLSEGMALRAALGAGPMIAVLDGFAPGADENAALVPVLNSLGDVLARAAANDKPVVMVAESLPRAKLRANPDYPDAADPHVWMDPVLWAEAAGSIAAALARLLPESGQVFEANLAALRRRLLALHEYGARVMASIPPRQRLLVTAHDAFGYFAPRYGLEVDSIQGLSTESEANLARIEALVRSLVERRSGLQVLAIQRQQQASLLPAVR